MCGIAGIAGLDSHVSRVHVERMCDAMVRRGPDASGIFSSPSVTLGHRRLKVLELSEAGRQPMTDRSGRFTLVFNGEIYNHRTLRPLLESHGHVFSGNSDTEVLLASFVQFGEDCLSHIEGMFAFAVHDARDESLFLTRDPLGMKPLYFAELGGRFVFASESHALLASGLVPKEISPLGIGQTVMMGAPIDGQTTLDHVKFLGPGEILRVKTGRINRYQYRRATLSIPNSAASCDELHEITRRVVDEHLSSDVPLAFLLSGGIDSTTLLALARQASDRDLHAFTLGFAESHLDESDVARETARRFNVEHTVVTVSADDLYSHVDSYLNDMDLPILDGFNVYSICRIVRDVGFVVLLSGQGGDEAFCGYDSFHNLPKLWRLLKLLQYVPHFFRSQLSRAVNFRGESFGRSAKLAAIVSGSKGWTDSYLQYRSIFSAQVFAEVLQPEVVDAVAENLRPFVERFDGELNSLNDISRVSDLETRIYMHDTLLRASDVSSMAHSIELRLPFVDRRILECVQRFPAEMRVNPSIRKPLLTGQVLAQLPASMHRNRKAGFHIPVGRILVGPMRERFREMLHSDVAFPPHIFQAKTLQELFAGLEQNPDHSAYSHAMWGLFVLGHWMQQLAD